MQEQSDILQPLQFDDWLPLKKKLRRDWPHFAYYYYWVDNAIKWKTKEPDMKLYIYCPEGKLDAGVFIGIEAFSIYSVTLFAFQESKELLRDCIVKTKLIDWSVGVILPAIHEYFENSIFEAIGCLDKAVQLKVHDKKPSNYYFESKEDCQAADLKIPADMKLEFLQESDAQLVHNLWPRLESTENLEKSRNFITTLIRLNRGIGLRKKYDNSLVSWVLHSNWGGLGVVQTVNEHQGKGYAKIVVNALSKHLASEDLDVTSFVIKGNAPSKKLFSCLNFKQINAGVFIVMKPLKNEREKK